MSSDYDTSGPGGFYWGPLYGLLAAPPTVQDFHRYDAVVADQEAARERLSAQQAWRMVKCCDAGRTAYPEACPWHPNGGEPERVRRSNLRKLYR